MNQIGTEEKPAEPVAKSPASQAGIPPAEQVLAPLVNPNHTHRPKREPVKLLPHDPHERTLWQRLNHSLLYGARQTFFCLSTDIVEPFLSKWFQNKIGDKKHEVTITHTFGGEAAGDFAAFGAYVGIKTFFSAPVNMAIDAIRSIGGPILNWMGKNSVKRWAEEHNVSENDPRYQKRVSDYATFQAENAVDSAIIATTATGMNLVVQRRLGNQQTYGTMLKGKYLGAGLTLAAMFLSSVFFPKATRRIEDTIEKKAIDPVMNGFKRILGLHEEPTPAITKTPDGQTMQDIALSPEKREGLVIMVAEHARKINWNDAKQRSLLLAKQKTVYEAFVKALDAEGPLVKHMIEEHAEVLGKEHRDHFNRELDQFTRDHESSRLSVQASAAHKRRDMRQFIALLNDATFLADVKKVIDSGKLPERKNTSITPEQKRYMSESLLEQSAAQGSDIADAAEAQALDYKALAHALEPEGSSARILAIELKKHLPTYDAKDIDGIAKDYMGYYRQEALNMVRELTQGSSVVTQAAERASVLRNRFQPATNAAAQAI